MSTATLYVVSEALNVRAAPMTSAAVVGKLTHGTKVTVKYDNITYNKAVGGGKITLSSPRLLQNGDVWVFLTAPTAGWAAEKHSNKRYLSKTAPKPGNAPPADGGSSAPPVDGGGYTPEDTTTGGLGFLGFAAVAGLAWWFLGRKKGKK
tara:strand:+ start:6672 stop:7118 length:447 start_codon:yes stop_codon:yes gene_type:complete